MDTWDLLWSFFSFWPVGCWGRVLLPARSNAAGQSEEDDLSHVFVQAGEEKQFY